MKSVWTLYAILDQCARSTLHWSHAMKERIKKGDNEDLRYDWKGDLIAIFLMSIIAALFVVVWVYWTETQLGR